MRSKKSESANNITSLPEPLTTFPLFPRLPIDLRLYIYRIATPYERFVHLEAIFDNTDSATADEELEEWQQPSDENYHNLQALDRVLQEYLMDNKERGMRFFSNRGQAQLERYGFTSPHPRPVLLSDVQLRVDTLRSFLANRTATMWSPNPIPALLHVCRESRDYLRRLGYELAFPTYTSPAATWFNFSDDVLFLEPLTSGNIAELNELVESGIPDGGSWHLGQCGESLERIKKLAVPVPDWYLHTKEIPFNIHEIVQQCGSLQELCFVKNAWYDWYQSNDLYWSCKTNKTVRRYMGTSPDQWPVRVEVALEVMWGQSLPLSQYEDGWQIFPEGTLSNELAEGIEKQIQSHDSVLHPTVDEKFRRQSWTTPNVTFGVVIAQEALELFLKKRHRFVRQNENADWCMEPYARYFDRHFHQVSQADQGPLNSPTEENKSIILPFRGWKIEVTKYIYGPFDLPWPLGLVIDRGDNDVIVEYEYPADLSYI